MGSGGLGASESSSHPGDTYIWKQGRHTVTLSCEAGAWVVRFTTAGRLFGPTETLYEERHTSERFACWDVMARVIRATHDEDEGVRAGRAAAAWINRRS
jgi:hypothetical protein